MDRRRTSPLSRPFSLAELVDQTTTLYLVVDEEKLSVYAGFRRVMVGCAINALTRAKSRKRPKHKVLLLLDEAAALGSLEPLERGVGYLRAYCTPILIFQDMHQLKALYRRWGCEQYMQGVLQRCGP
ncbi:type IV secretory system conjugative DNA transfer family protein [Bradyrhizobium sp. IC4060]|nr:type IV secretory system conjugative DNA transfer family protein [Bradyrhizobium sp. IC4060]MCA1489056.1 type IV secretory system conjugative DNA transfer family protein [Bradyrhizobium sp. IC4061]